jgi:hypothetical protein
MVETPKFIFAGKLNRDFFITADGKPILDTFGGNLPYAAVGFKIWEESPPPGLMARVGEDYPQKWLDDLTAHGFDTQGITMLPDAIDVRNFYVYTDKATRSLHYAETIFLTFIRKPLPPTYARLTT